MIAYSKIEGMPERVQFHGILEAYERIFESRADSFNEEMKERRRLVTFTAAEGSQLVGFKMGYERKKNHFYSWVGGVLPDQRGRGTASELMRCQHEWCRLNGYQKIRTQTKNRWKDMLILNLRHGYNVIGTYVNEEGETKIMLEKRIY